MQILLADYIYTPQGFQQNLAVAFDGKIQAIDTLKNLSKAYPNALVIPKKENSILYPGFINTHVHLEFSANKTSLAYGDFMSWLDTVIEHRNDLMGNCDNAMMMKECYNMLDSGITTFGAISSFANELEVCEQSPQRVVFFNELIGSNAMVADMLYADFIERVTASSSCEAQSKITPAIAIHSPYAVHPILVQKAVNVAKKHQMPLSAHLLESQAERQWLDKGEGEFKEFFEKYFKTSVPVTSAQEFIHAFDTYPTHFTHATQATHEELSYLAQKGHSIAHCPRSNRYLACGRLPLEILREKNLKYSIATDGLSSNDSLNIFDELRATLMLHHQAPLTLFASKLIQAITADAGEILKLKIGKIEKGYCADFALVCLDELPTREEELALWTILQSKKVQSVYIEGTEITY